MVALHVDTEVTDYAVYINVRNGERGMNDQLYLAISQPTTLIVITMANRS